MIVVNYTIYLMAVMIDESCFIYNDDFSADIYILLLFTKYKYIIYIYKF